MVGDRIRMARQLRGLTQAELAKRAKIDERQIGRYERGEHTPNAEIIAVFARAMEVSSDYLLELVDDPSAPFQRLTRREELMLRVFRETERLEAEIAEIEAQNQTGFKKNATNTA